MTTQRSGGEFLERGQLLVQMPLVEFSAERREQFD